MSLELSGEAKWTEEDIEGCILSRLRARTFTLRFLKKASGDGECIQQA